MTERENYFVKELIHWLKALSFALVIFFFINNVVIVRATVPTASMDPTIPAESQIFGFRLSYIFSSPSRFDVIAFESPDGTDTRYIKRIIGLPGETVDIIKGQVFINGSGEALNEWYLLEAPAGVSLINQSFVVPDEHFFVMGDHRNNSRDSRGLCAQPWENLFVPKGNIIGRAIFIYAPSISLIR